MPAPGEYCGSFDASWKHFERCNELSLQMCVFVHALMHVRMCACWPSSRVQGATAHVRVGIRFRSPSLCDTGEGYPPVLMESNLHFVCGLVQPRPLKKNLTDFLLQPCFLA